MTDPAARDFDARIADAIDQHRKGRLADAEAAYRKILDDFPDQSAVIHNLGVIAAETGRPAEAIEAFDRVIAVDPAHASAHFNKGNALRTLGDRAAAIDCYRQAVRLAPDHYEAHLALGFLWQALGEPDRALDHFARTLDLRRGDDRTGMADESFRYATRAKLLHDADQFRHIGTRGRDSRQYERRARAYESIARQIEDTVGNNDVVLLTEDQLDALGEGYNTAVHVIDAPARPDRAMNPALDRTAISQSYRNQAPGIAWFDDFLAPQALVLLNRYLLESTIWFDYTHIGGFLAAYLEDGLACPLILQIADDVRRGFPEIIGDHVLAQGWAFKGVAGDLPIDLHADDAAVSLNFWVTPDAANRDPDHGGLALYRTPPPAGWKIQDYDSDARLIAAFVADHADDRLVIPYRQNRAVLFDSRLFHGSDAPDFAPGYAKHRINITLLYE